MGTLKIDSYRDCFMQQLHKLQLDNKFCDISLKTGQDQIFIHRVVLLAASPNFQNEFFESNSISNGLQVLNCDGFSKDVLQTIVSFIYSGRLDVGFDNKEQLYKVCVEFKLMDAVKALHEQYPDINYLNATDASDREDTVSETGVSDSPKTKKRKYTVNGDKFTDKEPDMKKKYVRSSQRTGNKKSKYKDLPKTKANVSESSSQSQIGQLKLKKSRQTKAVKGRKTAKSKLDKCEKVDIPPQIDDYFSISETGLTSESIQSINDEKDSEIISSVEIVKDCDQIETNFLNGDDFDSINESGEQEIKCLEIDDVPDFDEKKTIKDVGPKKTRRKRGITDNKVKKEKKKRIYNRKNIQHPCKICNKVLTSSSRLVFHEFNKHGIAVDETKHPLYPCEEKGCYYVASTRFNLKTHMKNKHIADRPHVCEFCGKAFKLPNTLATHINLHTGLKIWKCDQCGETFNQQSGLDIHIKRHHIGERAFGELCHLCPERFLQKSDLAWHLFKTHSEPLPDKYKAHTCPKCNYSTKSKQDLERHMNAHEGIKHFFCSICQKRCISKSELRRHMGFHGEKKFKCNYESCTYASTEERGLEKHIKLMHTHKNFKPFLCPVCPYKTGLKGNLDKHIRSVHNLVVVTKHTVELKMKYANFESGDVISKEGNLVASAQERKTLQAEYEAQNMDTAGDLTMTNSDTCSLGNVIVQPIRSDVTSFQDFKMDSGTNDMDSVVTNNLKNVDLRHGDIPGMQRNTNSLGCEKVIASRINTSTSQIGNINESTTSINRQSEEQEMSELTNYVYVSNSEPISAAPVSVIAEDLRNPSGTQSSSASGHYSASQSLTYLENV